MRRFPFRSVVVSLLLVTSLSSISAVAAMRDGGGRDRDTPILERIIKTIAKTLKFVTFSDTMSTPKP